jgi:hypothetical protein
MTLKITPAASANPVDRVIFLSASIPDPSRWDGDFDALEITDAVVSLARVFLTAGWRIVTAAHPTIAPLLLYVAAEIPATADRRVSIYQSSLFEDVLPTATRRFEADGIGTIIWTPAADGDHPNPGEWDASLDIMRRRMLTETAPVAAAFVGGMQGIRDEYNLFAEFRPGRVRYPLGRPGGAAAALAEESDSPLRQQLTHAVVYPAIWQAVLMEIEAADEPQ